MYIPIWLIVVIGLVATYLFTKKRDSGNRNSIEDIEQNVSSLKGRIFSLAHFDSPHFIDCQEAFGAMEVNYLRLKQRLSHDEEKTLEIAKDWVKYTEALGDCKHVRIMLDVDMSDDAWERAEEDMKEPAIIKEEIEKKFQSLLKDDFQQIPPDYFERMDTMKKPTNEEKEEYEDGHYWKHYYQNSANLMRLEEERKKKDKKS